MLKKIKKMFPALLYGFLCLVLAVLFFVVATEKKEAVSVAEDTEYTEVSVINPIEETQETNDTALSETNKNEPSEPSENKNNKPSEENQESISQEKIEETLIQYTDVCPREGKEGTQKIYGEGIITFLTCHPAPQGNYTLVYSECSQGDIAGENPCIGIVKTNENCDIVSTYRLKTDFTQYITSQITTNGLAIVSTNREQKQYLLTLLSYDFTTEYTTVLTAGKSASLLPTEDSFLLLCSHNDEDLLYSFQNNRLLFQSIPSGNLVDYFEFDTYFLLYLQQENKYLSVKIDKNTLSATDITFYDNTLLYIFPLYEKELKFITIEQKDAVYVYKRTKNGIETEKKLGNLSILYACQSPKGIFIQCDGNICGQMYIQNDLTAVFSEENSIEKTSILDTYFQEELFLLCSDSNKLTVINSVGEVLSCIPSPCEKGFLTLLKKDLFFVAYQENRQTVSMFTFSLPDTEWEGSQKTEPSAKTE